jgi:hypothetical protein
LHPSLVALKHFSQQSGSAFTQSRCAATLDANTRQNRKEKRGDDSILIVDSHLEANTSKSDEEREEEEDGRRELKTPSVATAFAGCMQVLRLGHTPAMIDGITEARIGDQPTIGLVSS